ncbi:MAG: 2-C-methyl-D-erythritol 4-phosphate cytidylyltransferase [Ignavibacteriaceae bacterium]
MKTFAVIPAGGKGIRSGFAAPKQYLKFNDKELIIYTLEIFQKNNLIDEIIISASKQYFPLLKKLKKKFNLSKISQIVESGKERQDSVYNALNTINAKKNDLIIVHDAARPLLPQEVLTNAVDIAKKKGNALVCIKAKDTLIKGEIFVKDYLDRDEIYYAQTPQIFRYSDLMKAMKKAFDENFLGTDESMLIKKIGKKIYIVEGSPLNFKITSKEDVEMLKKMLSF